MTDPTTTNRGFVIPTRGSDVGTWDVPINGNSALLDTIVGGVATISATGGTITLSSAQAACGTIVFTGALSSNLIIVFPAAQGWWTVANLTTNNSSFAVFIEPSGGSAAICAPPGEYVDIQMNTGSPQYRNLGRVGSLMELATPTIPLWIAGCTVPPYLNCDGSTFSAGTYPQLAALLGGTTLPDTRGRVRATLNQGTGRLTSGGSGVNGDVNESAGGSETVILTAAQIPTINSGGINTVTVNSTVSNIWQNQSGSLVVGGSTPGVGSLNPIQSSGTPQINVTSTNTGGNPHNNTQPTYVAGYTLIRAA